MSDRSVNHNQFSVWGFIKGFGKLLIGFLLLLQGLIGLILLLLVVAVFTNIAGNVGGNNDKLAVNIQDGSAFLFNPRGLLTEVAPPEDPIEDLISEAYGLEEVSPVALSDAIRSIRAAKADKRIKAMVLNLDGLAIGGTSKAYALIDEIEAFKADGKKVYAVGNFFSQAQYLIASHADEIHMNKSGGLSLYGYGVYRTYYKSLLEKLKITSHVFRVGTYKAAVEPQLRDDMSPEAKEANRAFVGALWDRYLAKVSEQRGIPAEAINDYADKYNEILRQYQGDGAKAAVDIGLIDKISRPSELRNFLVSTFGKGEGEKDFKFVAFQPYLRTLETQENDAADKVAVITAAGTIVPGKGSPGTLAGSATIVNYLKKARTDDKVKAVVLRVDSPGGSAYASEVIHDAILELKAANKPVVVSMGSLAASGGYLISAPADEIWAAPTTITGSIGIFATLTTFENLATEAGVYTDGVGTTSQSAILGTGIGALPESTAEALQLSTEDGYNDFLTVVAEGRGLDKAYVDTIAQGRIWTGEKALELKLVDQLGGLEDAVKAAAGRANLTSYEVYRYEDKRTPFEKLFGGTTAKVAKATGLHKTIARHQQSGLGQVLRTVDEHAAFLNTFNDPNGLYVRCLPCEGITQK